MRLVIDDNRDIIGMADTEEAARRDAERRLRNSPHFLTDFVADMKCLEATPRLALRIASEGMDVQWWEAPDGRAFAMDDPDEVRRLNEEAAARARLNAAAPDLLAACKETVAALDCGYYDTAHNMAVKAISKAEDGE